MVLSQYDLISKAAGLLVGYASWSHFPQLLTVYAEKPTRGGLSWKLLILWIFADTFSLLGVTLGAALQTQVFQFIWYLFGDSMLFLQQAFYHGYLPFTQRQRQRKADEHGAARALVISQQMTKDSPWIVKNQDKVEARRREMEAAAEREEGLHRPARPSMKSIRKSPGRPRREEYVELLPGKDRRRRRGQWGEDESEEEPRTPPGPRGLELLVIHFFGRWNAVTQPICLVILSCIMLFVWYLTAYSPRASLDHIEHPPPPIEDGEVNSQALVAWVLACIGTALNNIPRSHQLYITVKTKSTEGVEPYMFIALISESAATLVSILIVSQDSGYLFSESPFLAGVVLAFSLDITFIVLHLRYSGRERISAVERPWSSPTYIVDHQLLAAPSPKTDAHHRKALARRRREHLRDSDRFLDAAPHLTVQARRHARNNLQHQREELKKAQEQLDQHVESSGDEARIRAHVKSGLAHRREVDEVQHQAEKRGAQSLQRAERDWRDWKPSSGGELAAPRRSVSPSSRATRLRGDVVQPE